jgi:hypothetical protein
MLLRHRLLQSENHIGKDVGDLHPVLRADFEDSLVQALEDTLLDRRLDAFRSYLRKWRSEWPEFVYELCMTQDAWGWYTVYYYTCKLQRMMPRWEHAANKLKDEFGMDPNDIPPGTEFLHL